MNVNVEPLSSGADLAGRSLVSELQREFASGRTAEQRDHSVFVTTGTFRVQALRALGCLVGTLTLLWLVALIAGAVGAGRLPAVPFPAIGALGQARAANSGQQAALRPSLRHATLFGGIVDRGRLPARRGSRDRSRPDGLATSLPAGARGRAPRSVERTARGGGVRPRRPAPGNVPRAAGHAPGGPGQPLPGPSQAGGTMPRAAVPGPARSPVGSGGSRPPVGDPPTSGPSEAHPANRPVDPPASPPAAPPAAAQGTAHSPTAG